MALTDNLGSNVLSVIDTTPTLAMSLEVPNTGWEADSEGYYNQVPVSESQAVYKPDFVVDEAKAPIAARAGLYSTCESGDGFVKFRAMEIPTEPITGKLTLTIFSGDPGKATSPLMMRLETLEAKAEDIDKKVTKVDGLLEQTAQAFGTMTHGGGPTT